MNTNQKIAELRKLMKAEKLSAYIINTADPHMSEYIHEHYQSRAWISGFTGSQGTALVTKDKALLWADGRYFIQAENQIADSEFKLMKIETKGYPTITEWLFENLEKGDKVGVDGSSYSAQAYKTLKKRLNEKEIEISGNYDLISGMWEDRPALPNGKVFVLEEKYSGKSVFKKLTEVRDMMKNESVSHYVISSLDDIAWLFNIRGADIPCNPIVISYAIITSDSSTLYVDSEKLNDSVKEYFDQNNISISDYENIFKDLGKLASYETVYLDGTKTNQRLLESIPQALKIKNGLDFTTTLKAIKNETEIENQKIAYIKDGAALVKFFKWLEDNVPKGDVTESSASEKLLSFRKELPLFRENSFNTISAYGSNAAMMHYSPETGNNAVLEERGYYLVDSGGQYLNGTTDITRTVSLGELSEEEKIDYTLTLKGIIALSSMKFLYGASGHSLDAICRYALWQNGYDYKCGTGHGIGYMLNVHEGPFKISFNGAVTIPLEEGMITSIEPGVYKEGKHGIRTENVVVVKEWQQNDSGRFMHFETLTMVYIDTKPILTHLLEDKEIKWLNDYNREVYEKVSPLLNEQEKAWLWEKTESII